MNIRIPEEYLVKAEKAYKRFTDGSLSEPEPEIKKIIPSSSILKPEDYVFLEGRTHGNYSYPDILVSTERKYNNHDWYQAHEALKNEDSFMLTIRQFVDFLDLLKSGKAFDGKRNLMQSSDVIAIYNSITEQIDPLRAEWLDAKFGDKTITYHKIENGKLEEVTESLEDCLMEDKTPGIDLDSWIKNANYQGLPKKNIKKGDMYYRKPRDDRVARFGADSDGVYLNCDRDPQGVYADLWVRPAKIF